MSKFFPYHDSVISKESLKTEDFQRMREMFNLYQDRKCKAKPQQQKPRKDRPTL